MIQQLMQTLGRKPRAKVRKVRPTRPSRRAESAYLGDLLSLVRELEVATERYLLPVLKRTEPQYIRATDGATRDGFASDILAAIDEMAQAFGGINRIAARLAQNAVERQADETARQLALNLESVLGVNLFGSLQSLNVRGEIEAAVVQNTQLIKSLPSQYLSRVEGKVLEAVRAGTRYEHIVKEIQAETGIAERRAKLIARDQMAKVNGNITEAKQVALGITEYEWVTAGDERVRENHRAKNGQVFKWSDPPADTGHPGDDYQCRCIARPIIKFDE